MRERAKKSPFYVAYTQIGNLRMQRKKRRKPSYAYMRIRYGAKEITASVLSSKRNCSVCRNLWALTCSPVAIPRLPQSRRQKIMNTFFFWSPSPQRSTVTWCWSRETDNKEEQSWTCWRNWMVKVCMLRITVECLRKFTHLKKNKVEPAGELLELIPRQTPNGDWKGFLKTVPFGTLYTRRTLDFN